MYGRHLQTSTSAFARFFPPLRLVNHRIYNQTQASGSIKRQLKGIAISMANLSDFNHRDCGMHDSPASLAGTLSPTQRFDVRTRGGNASFRRRNSECCRDFGSHALHVNCVCCAHLYRRCHLAWDSLHRHFARMRGAHGTQARISAKPYK